MRTRSPCFSRLLRAAGFAAHVCVLTGKDPRADRVGYEKELEILWSRILRPGQRVIVLNYHVHEVQGRLRRLVRVPVDALRAPRLGHADGRALPLRREGVGAVRVPAAGRPGGEVRPRGPPAVRRVAEGPDKRSTILERELANEFSKIKINTLIFVRLSVFFL